MRLLTAPFRALLWLIAVPFRFLVAALAWIASRFVKWFVVEPVKIITGPFKGLR